MISVRSPVHVFAMIGNSLERDLQWVLGEQDETSARHIRGVQRGKFVSAGRITFPKYFSRDPGVASPHHPFQKDTPCFVSLAMEW